TRQAAGAPQPKPEPTAARETILERALDVRDSRALVLEDHTQSAPVSIDYRLQPGRPASPVINRVPGQLAGRRDDFCLIDEAEVYLQRLFPDCLPDPHDIVRCPEMQGLTSLDGHSAPCPRANYAAAPFHARR